jgi:hypothetical protein
MIILTALIAGCATVVGLLHPRPAATGADAPAAGEGR